MKIKTVGVQKSIFGEGILWDAQKEMVLWVDVASSKVLTYSTKTSEEVSYQLPTPATAILKYSDEDYLLIMGREINRLNSKTGELTHYISFDWLDPRLLINDAKLDKFGRIWTGSVDVRFKQYRESEHTAFKEYAPKIGHMYMIDHDLTVKTFDYKVALSNGLAFHPTEDKLYHVDSGTQGIWSYDVDMESGDLTNRERVYEFDILEGFPDGMTIDRDGMLWTAVFKSRQVAQKTKRNGYIAQINPQTKELVQTIELPISHITSCQFGGVDLNELFVTTASELLNEQQLKEQPLSGNLLSMKLPTKGIVQHSIKNSQIK